MAISKIDIINAALLLIGAKKLFSLTDDTKAAELANAMYELARNEIYNLPVNWKFATTRTKLSEYDIEPISGYEHQYELPSGFVRIISTIDDAGDDIEYSYRRELYVRVVGEQENEIDMLLTNEDEVFIKYLRIREDVSKWPTYFTKLVYTNLAVILCEPLKQKASKQNQLLLMLEDAYKLAREADGMDDSDSDDNNNRFDKGNNDILNVVINEEIDNNYIVRES